MHLVHILLFLVLTGDFKCAKTVTKKIPPGNEEDGDDKRGGRRQVVIPVYPSRRPPAGPPTHDMLSTTADMSLETLSAVGYAALLDSKKPYKGNSKEYDKDFVDAQNEILQKRIDEETADWLKIRHIQTTDDVKRVCYCMGVTYLNAMQDLRKYFKIRYLYYNTLEYEVGYMTQQIVFKYQLVLELFHMVQAKFVWYRNFAPPTYMFYMYTNILDQCRHIIHLCNMMNELENKYQNPNLTIFDDYPEGLLKEHREQKPRLYKNSAEERRVQQAKMMKRQKKREMAGMVNKKSFTTTERTRSPRSSGRFNLHYGWSIETW